MQVERSDCGVYTCRGTNSAGTATGSAELMVNAQGELSIDTLRIVKVERSY